MKIFEINGSDRATIVVIEHNDKKRFVLGAYGDYAKVGDIVRITIDTERGHRDGGSAKVENVLHWNNGKITSINGIGLNEKRPLHVFK